MLKETEESCAKVWLQTLEDQGYTPYQVLPIKSVQTLRIMPGRIDAFVKDGPLHPYRVHVELRTLDNDQIHKTYDLLRKVPFFKASLSQDRLTKGFFQKFQDIFTPTKFNKISCSCAKGESIACRHIGAVLYALADQIETDPFKFFQLYGCDLSDAKESPAPEIPYLESSILPSKEKRSFRAAAIEKFYAIQFRVSHLPFHKQLSPAPSFFEKDFREILRICYSHWEQNPKGSTENVLSYAYIYAHDPDNHEKIFKDYWGRIEEWSRFTFIINESLQVLDISTGLSFPFHDEDASFSVEQFVRFLHELPASLVTRLPDHLQILCAVNRLCESIIKNGIFIPQILKNHKKETFMRWIPNFLNSDSKESIHLLASICPDNLVEYWEKGKKQESIHQDQQILMVLSFLIKAKMHHNMPENVMKYAPNDVLALFFEGKPLKEKNDLCENIAKWLSPLRVDERPYTLALRITERSESRFCIRVQIKDRDIMTYLSEHPEHKRHLFSDMVTVSDRIPFLEKSFENNTSETIVDGATFYPIYQYTLPKIRSLGFTVYLPAALDTLYTPELFLHISETNAFRDDIKGFLNLEDLLQTEWKVAIGDYHLSLDVFNELLKTSRGLVRYEDRYIILDEDDVRWFTKKIDRIPERLTQIELMQGALSGDFTEFKVVLSEAVRRFFDKLHTYRPVPIPSNLNAKLRPYQERGASWLIQNMDIGFGSIIADDMGLGKTIQVITVLQHYKNEGFIGKQKALVIAPAGLLNNWQKEIERFAPNLRTLIYHGHNRSLDIENYDIVLTSYGLVRRDKTQLNKIKWFVTIIDEAQNIKNPDTEQTKAIKSLKSSRRIAMSGTPVENRLLEYWSIFDFTNKSYLGTGKHFKDHFAKPIENLRDERSLERFSKITQPFILRRLKSDKTIIHDLPDKIENNRYCELTTEQTTLYKKVVEQNLGDIETSDGIQRKGLILKLITALKQICNHPSHFQKKKEVEIDHSGKMTMLIDVLSGIDEMREKTLIFTQYREMGELLVPVLEKTFGSPVPFLHGSLSLKERETIVHDFQNAKDIKTLVLSLKAGGTGLNLTAANHVIHYDLWWNPAVESQATDRAYRIGQGKNVWVYRLLTSNTFEERIDEMLQRKKDLANLTVESGEAWLTELNNDQIRDLFTLSKAA